jgi:organic radical activating enzyme
MKTSEVLHAWTSILTGHKPALSIEITKECPLRCPGCYAYDPAHLGGDGVVLRQLADYKGDQLVENILAVVEEHQPMHVSLVGGDPLVRYRELETLLPELDRRGVYTQLVTSAFRALPKEWNAFSKLNVVVSVDGLQSEHDERRKPATYERILKTTEESSITIHCTITGQIAGRTGYLEEFLRFWSERPQVKRIWISLFTPQRGASGPEILTPAMRKNVIDDLQRLYPDYPKLELNEAMIREMRQPPQSPADCIFARTTTSLSADLKTQITPCQFGGDPDCSQCGCIASVGLSVVGHHRLMPGLTAGKIFAGSLRVGDAFNRLRALKNRSRPQVVKSPSSKQFIIVSNPE